jgi:hypothetical protein
MMDRRRWGACVALSLLINPLNIYADFAYDSYSFGSSAEGSMSAEIPVERSYSSPRLRDEEAQYVYNSHSSRRTRHTRTHEIEMPQHIQALGEKVIIVDPNTHSWGAYNAHGELVRSGLATSGSHWCPDLGRSCRTAAGSFRIVSLGSRDCFSRKFPLGRGGAPMPYCMFFNRSQALHGSYEVAPANVSHGCVRLHVSDAEWLRYNFATIGTKVIIRAY